MNTFSDLIDAFTVPVVAEVLGLSRKHVHTMRARKAVPPLHWGALIEAAPRYGIELDHTKCRSLYESRVSEAAA